MKAISLWQPWATLMALDLKKIETRSWPTSYRGPLAIASTKSIPVSDRADCEEAFQSFVLEYPEFEAAMTAQGVTKNSELPHGAVLCVRNLFVCHPAHKMRISDQERDMGYYAEGRFGWCTRLVEVFPEPIPCKGAQGLWEWVRP